MMVVILAVLAVVLVLLERKWAVFAINELEFKQTYDYPLAEPDQVVTCHATVVNRSRLPISFVRLLLDFPGEVRPAEERIDQDMDRQEKVLSWYSEHRLTLPGRRSITKKIALTFPHRGVYTIGAYHLSTGDLLGFREETRHGAGQRIVVMPRRSAQHVAVDALGGFLGDVSVRRFILEDPILTIGFRDYTGREPMRAISWTRTAQTGALQVKQYDHTAERHVVVLLNTEGATAAQLEECFCLTRSVCEKLEEKKIPYGFATNGNLPGPMGKIHRIVEGLGQQHINTILYGLGRADKTCFYSFRTLTRNTLKKRKSNESYIVIVPKKTGEVNHCIQQLRHASGNPVGLLNAQMQEEKR